MQTIASRVLPSHPNDSSQPRGRHIRDFAAESSHRGSGFSPSLCRGAFLRDVVVTLFALAVCFAVGAMWYRS